MGRPMPGYRVLLLDPDGKPAKEGEVCLALGADRPAGLMQGYADTSGKLGGADGEVYRTGDVASIDEDGYLTFVGRADDVFKSSDYRISPFELESVLIEHEAVAEAAIVPSPDEIRLSVPKAFILLVGSAPPTRDTAASILKYCNTRLAPFKRIRRIEFVTELPKTISGKIRRTQLRKVEYEGAAAEVTRGVEFHEKDVLGG
jgi:acetyl-CoA synthetase